MYTRIVKDTNTIALKAVIDHITHVINIGGIDCIGIGSDFDGMPSTPVDFSDVSCYPKLITGLQDRGYNEKEKQRIMGVNRFHFLQRFDK